VTADPETIVQDRGGGAGEQAPAAAQVPPRAPLGVGVPRPHGVRPRLSLDAAAAFAVFVDSVRTRTGVEGGTLVYVIRWA
jgi:hypothetical protein